jgi:thymidylate synthase ThyX
MLPLATNTSLGQIVNARTLETQVSRLLSHTHAEVRELGARMKEAARTPSYNVNHDAFRTLVEAIRARDESLGILAEAQLLREVKASPTLVKYAEPNQYEIATRSELAQAARELMRGANIEAAPSVDLLEDDPLEIEIATTLLYEQSHYSYRQLRRAVESLSDAQRAEIIDLGMKHRGRHDELLRDFAAGQKFRYDILMDIGGYRDMHRHRRCVQIGQAYTFAHGFETPAEITAAGHADRYSAAMRRAESAASALAQAGAESSDTQYLIPLAYRKRTLFKMDFSEVVYISELRTTPAGHWSYRKVAWEMYEAAARRFPALAKYFRVHDIHAPVDLLQR